jgi:hypothetical protein
MEDALLDLVQFIVGLIVFALLLVALFPWFDRAHVTDHANYNSPLADAPEIDQAPPTVPADSEDDRTRTKTPV